MISDTEPHQKTDSARGRSDLEDYKTETSSSPSSRRARSPLYGKMPSGNMAARLWLCALSYASVHHPYIIPIAPEVVECQVRGLCSSARHTPVSSHVPHDGSCGAPALLASGRAVRNTQHPTPSSPPLCPSGVPSVPLLQAAMVTRIEPWIQRLSHPSIHRLLHLSGARRGRALSSAPCRGQIRPHAASPSAEAVAGARAGAGRHAQAWSFLSPP